MHARSIRAPRCMAIVALTFAAACTRAGTPGPVPSNDTNQENAVVPASDADRDAIDLLVVLHAITVAREWGRAPDLAPALKARVAPYEGRVQIDFAIEGVDDSVTAEGVRTGMPPGARFGATLTGALRAAVQIAGGEVGLERGDVYAAEGTLATVDGRAFRRTSGRWLPAAAAGR